MKIGSALRNRFDNARLPLSLLVILIHCSPYLSPDFTGEKSLPLVEIILKVANIAVPTFFFISGFLTGNNHKNDNIADYKRLLANRSKSLLLPYLLWNILAWAIRAAVRMIMPGFCSVSGGDSSIFASIYQIFWIPEIEPLWFLRNLIIFVVCTPLLVRGIKCLRWTMPMILFAAGEYFEIAGLFYYGLGLYFSICVRRAEAILSSKAGCSLLLPWAIYCVAAPFIELPGLINGLLVAIVYGAGAVGFVAALSRRRPHGVEYSQSLSFFIYCFHGIVSPYILKLISILGVHPGGVDDILDYILNFAAILIVTIFAWLILKLTAPKMLAILTGNRRLPPQSPL